MNSGWVAGRQTRGGCRLPAPGTDGQRATAATTADHNRLGSLSSGSMPTHATSIAVLVRAQSASSSVFP